MLEQTQLIARLGGFAEQRLVEFVRGATLVEAEALARLLEAQLQQVGIGARAGHALAPFRGIDLAAARLLYQRENVLRLVGVMAVEPVLDQRPQFERQPQQDRAGIDRAVRRAGLEDSVELTVIERRDHGGCEDAHRNPGVGQRPHRVESALRRRRARRRSSVVTEMATEARRSFAISARMSMSRATSADFVTMLTGWRNSRSTSSTRRVIWNFFSAGWYGSVFAPSAMVRHW